MQDINNKNKFTELAVEQNLFIWQLTKSFVDIEKKISAALSQNNKDS